MSDDGEDFEGDFDEEILYEDEAEDSDNDDKKSIKSSSSEEELIENVSDDDDEECINLDESEDKVLDSKKDSATLLSDSNTLNFKKFKDTTKIKNNSVLQKSNTPRTIIVVSENKKKTDNRLHRPELSNIISMRSEQIATYGTHFASLPVGKKVDEIAIKELYERKCPLMLRRSVGFGSNGETIVEIWDVNTMTLPPKHTI